MARSAATDEERVESLEEWLRQQTVAGNHPTRVEARNDEDSEGRTAWYLVVTMPVPAGAETWPVREVTDLDRRTRDKALELGVPWPWYVLLRPDAEDPPADEDVLGEPEE